MSADQVFSLASGLAVIGWLVLAFGAFLRREFLVTTLAGRIWPLGMAALYTALIIFFFRSAPGGFDSLPHVQLLFTSPWAATAGWVHYLAFDLFIGAWISKRVMEEGLPRLILLVLLPLTFLLGPIGFLGFEISRQLFRKVRATS
jgi:hypothetical protein